MSIITSKEQRAKETAAVRPASLPRAPVLAPAPHGPYVACKTAIEFTLALLLFMVTLPVVLLAMALIKLTSRGPALYTQTRLGKNGCPFVIYKLRTMAHQRQSLTGVPWSVQGDPRVTKLGYALRKLHIDELPQLWNVLKGDMSLVGPRPEWAEFMPALEKQIQHYRCRLWVKPGVTGLAQVQLPPLTDLGSVRLKLAYDIYYIRHRGLWLDFRILLCTGCKLWAMPRHIMRKIFVLPDPDGVYAEYHSLPADVAAAPAPRVQRGPL